MHHVQGRPRRHNRATSSSVGGEGRRLSSTAELSVVGFRHAEAVDHCREAAIRAMNEGLPSGWDIDRVRSMGLPEARLLDSGTPVMVEVNGGHQPLTPRVAIYCDGDYYLVLDDDGLWYVGHEVEGTVVCWASYGSDLEVAIQAL